MYTALRLPPLLSVRTLIPCVLTASLIMAAPGKPAFDSEKTYTPSNERVINVVQFGAVGNGSSHPLKEVFSTQEEVNAFYGGEFYKLDDERDYVAFCEALKVARRLGGKSADPKVNIDIRLPEIYLPNGKYLFNRTVLIENFYGCTIRGAGRAATTIEFTKNGGDLFMIVTAGELLFKGIGFSAGINRMSTIFHLDNISGPSGYGRPTFKVRFEEVNWSSVYRCIYATGEEMCSEVILDNCRMVNSLIGIHLNNPNALNYNLFACDFESRPDDGEKYLPFKASDCTYLLIERGGAINCFGGSVIHAGRTLYLKSKSTEQNYAGCLFFNFYGIKFEQHGHEPFLFDFDIRAYSPASVNFNDCSSFHSQSVAQSGQDESPNGRLGNGMNVSLNNCLFAHGYFTGFIDADTRKNWGSLVANNTRIFRYKEIRASDSADLADIHHEVSYRPVGGYREEDGELYRRVFKVQGLKEELYPTLSPNLFMAFDIPASDTSTVGIKRVVKKIDLTSLTSTHEMTFPQAATLSSVQVIAPDNSAMKINLRSGSDKINIGDLQIIPGKRKAALDHIEIKNDGIEWDGVLRASISSTKANTTVTLICEYF